MYHRITRKIAIIFLGSYRCTFREGNTCRAVPPIAIKSKLLRIDAHKPKLFGLNLKGEIYEMV